ncbi:MAG: cation transporter [Clostridiales bacterium]|nr:cation transporter [Clostridiales bacterium]
MIIEKRERQILLMSFISGLIFAVIEFIFSIYSHSQSALTDSVYDASELIFIALLLFLTPLFYKPVSEKHPYGYYQIESILLIIKGVMMLSVSMGISIEIIESALSGGNPVNNVQVSLFQLMLGIASIFIFIIMKKMNHNLSSPTVEAELLGWRIDIIYSLGMSIAFFMSRYLSKTPLSFIAPYFDQVIAVLVMIFMLPESVKVLWSAIKDVFLFSPDAELTEEVKELCTPIMEQFNFVPVFFDITKTGRHLWISIYFKIQSDSLAINDFKKASEIIKSKTHENFNECTCELILMP